MENLQELKNAIEKSEYPSYELFCGDQHTLNDGQIWLSVDDSDICYKMNNLFNRYLLKNEFFFEKNEHQSDVIHFKLSAIAHILNPLIEHIFFEVSDDSHIEGFITELIFLIDETPDSQEKNDFKNISEYYVHLKRLCKAQRLFAKDKENDIIFLIGATGKISIKQKMGQPFVHIAGECFFYSGEHLYVMDHTVSIQPQPLSDHFEAPIEIIGKEKQNQIYFDNFKWVRNKSTALYGHYKGISYIPGMFGSISQYTNTRVVCDYEGISLNDSHNFVELADIIQCSFFGGIENSVITCPLQNVSAHHLICMIPYEVFYNLENKQWMIGRRENIADINFNSDALFYLNMDETKKNTLKTICVNHNNNKGDIIDGKGGGHIFLLHGPPGTGKTLTAESIADTLEKPLFKVGIGELGTDLEFLERALKKVLSLAQHWKAILLIDEADVFMEERNTEHLERNAMVATFLRLLEYYSGILFLTTNRADNLDAAFKSRITFALHYPRQDVDNRISIWKSLLENENGFSESYIKELSRHKFNGRQIKNIINTARCMNNNGDINKENLDVIVKNTLDFENSI